MLFHHPPSNQTLSCGDGYRIDTVTPPGPHFGIHYDGNFIFTSQGDNANIHSPPTHEQNKLVYICNSDQPTEYHKAQVLEIPINDNSEPYTVLLENDGTIAQYLLTEILDHDPSQPPDSATTSQSPFNNLQWIKHKAKATLYLPHLMPRPKQGYLIHRNNEWMFKPGRKNR